MRFFYRLLLLSLVFSMPTLQVARIEAEDNLVQKRILIVRQESKFKDAVVLSVEQSLQRYGHVVKAIDLKSLSAESIEDYQAVVIVSTCWAWRLNRKVTSFLKRLSEDEKKKVILLTTANNESWSPKLTGVDAVTSASRQHKAAAVADTIVNKVRALLE